MNGVWALIAAVIAFGITAIMGKWMIPFLHKINFGQTIRDEGPKWHKKKQGTPTMGGIMFIIGILIATVVAVPCYWQISSDNVFQMSETGLMATKIFAGLCLALGYGLIGYLDDYIKVVRKRNLGLTVKQKLILQFLVAAAYLAAIYLSGGTGTTEIPFVGLVDLGWAYWLIAAVLIVGVVNAVNFTDGIDGLNGSVTFFFAVFCMVISSDLSMFGLSIMAAAVAGGCLGFLLWNFNPAKVFMGDTGSLFLGGAVCALTFGMDLPILLIPLGIIYWMEIGSVMLQVTYFKLTHGKRLFKMSPIHHHFELCGWNEVKICVVFSCITMIGGIASMLLVFFGV